MILLTCVFAVTEPVVAPKKRRRSDQALLEENSRVRTAVKGAFNARVYFGLTNSTLAKPTVNVSRSQLTSLQPGTHQDVH